MAYFATRNFPKAFEAGRRAVELSPRRERYRTNYALYATTPAASPKRPQQADQIVKAHPEATYAYLPLAVAALAGGKPDAARDAYQRMATTGTIGASFANMGLADMAIHQGRDHDADALLKPGLAEDRRANNTTLMATKHLALAEIASRAGEDAAGDRHDSPRPRPGQGRHHNAVPAARLFLRAGNETEPKRIAAELLDRGQPESRAYGPYRFRRDGVENKRHD